VMVMVMVMVDCLRGANLQRVMSVIRIRRIMQAHRFL
jgi:hypothetical protein